MKMVIIHRPFVTVLSVILLHFLVVLSLLRVHQHMQHRVRSPDVWSRPRRLLTFSKTSSSPATLELMIDESERSQPGKKTLEASLQKKPPSKSNPTHNR
ncbi:hypothetical protein CDL15_Pgr026538 [Punica granatum]|uniref:Uncharacterized protein n=1 Tax=Punica granatum TaxID=22663 RepID=A0A218WLU6_PUNGR|nr:hypothetical protein CDL15_Pgr026538 [Punica granatum]PKI56133.1 hypothetical protein CRG98_023487 [Punica granatum]